ncbi:hypothetical protein B484DRAFT_42048 [Ochromonadaceae sp. CCMP2298]|nr:hypothetical protein B484DRAFT_42048 [Ochromonadaceae sp. CCMP2298]
MKWPRVWSTERFDLDRQRGGQREGEGFEKEWVGSLWLTGTGTGTEAGAEAGVQGSSTDAALEFSSCDPYVQGRFVQAVGPRRAALWLNASSSSEAAPGMGDGGGDGGGGGGAPRSAQVRPAVVVTAAPPFPLLLLSTAAPSSLPLHPPATLSTTTPPSPGPPLPTNLSTAGTTLAQLYQYMYLFAL